MKSSKITAWRLNTWMHEHHADTVADLAQRGLDMDFFDAHAGRPTSLRLSSDKAPFGFHLPLPHNFQILRDMEPMMSSARTAAPGFQKATNAYGNSKAFMSSLIMQDGRGWQLHMQLQSLWKDNLPEHGESLILVENSFTVDTALINLISETDVLEFMRTELDLTSIINDSSRCSLNIGKRRFTNSPASACEFDLAPMGSEKARYMFCLWAVNNTGGGPMLASVIAMNYEFKHFTGTYPIDWVTKFALVGEEYPGYVPDTNKKFTFKLWDPEAFGMSKESLSIFMQLGVPLTQGLRRFQKKAPDSYDFDFSMNDQVSSSLSL